MYVHILGVIECTRLLEHIAFVDNALEGISLRGLDLKHGNSKNLAALVSLKCRL